MENIYVWCGHVDSFYTELPSKLSHRFSSSSIYWAEPCQSIYKTVWNITQCLPSPQNIMYEQNMRYKHIFTFWLKYTRMITLHMYNWNIPFIRDHLEIVAYTLLDWQYFFHKSGESIMPIDLTIDPAWMAFWWETNGSVCLWQEAPKNRASNPNLSLYSASQKQRKPINQVNFSENCNDLFKKVYIVTKFSLSSFFWHQLQDVLAMHGRARTISNGDVKIDLRRIGV